jgi:hypothetical protein
MPKRAGAFGQAEFSWKNWPSKKETFLVEGWADVDRKPCPHSLAVYAIIYFGDRALLPLKGKI